MTPNQVIKHYGLGLATKPEKIKATAKALKVSAALVYHWLNEDQIPLGRQALIQHDTQGKLRIQK